MTQPNCSQGTNRGKKIADKETSELCNKRSCFYCNVLPNLKIQGSAKSERASWQNSAVLVPEQLDGAASLPDLAVAARGKPAAKAPWS